MTAAKAKAKAADIALAEKIIQLAPKQREVFLANLSPSAGGRVRELIAQYQEASGGGASRIKLLPHQQLPEPKDIDKGAVLAGGRGAGKSFAAANYLARICETVPKIRARVIAPTLADAVQSVVLDPDSGVLAQSPSAVFKSSGIEGARVVWPNKSTLYLIGTPTLKDVDRLRALTNIDCIAEGVPVETARGAIAIEDVRPGDMVLTRSGYRRVLVWIDKGTRPTHELVTSAGILRGTDDHRCWDPSTSSWKELGLFKEGDMMEACPISSASTASPSTAGPTGTSGMPAGDSCTGPCGSTPTDLSRPATKCITTIETEATTLCRTSNSSNLPSITGCTCRSATPTPSISRDASPVCGGSGQSASRSMPCASSASSPSRIGTSPQSECASARQPVSIAIATGAEKAQSGQTPSASNVEPTSAPDSMSRPASPPERALARVLRSSPTGREERVFDLTIEGEHEFFAGGVLVHNCDHYEEAAANPRLAEAVKQADLSRRGSRLPHPIWIASTTPRPVPQYKEWLKDSRVVVKRASTLDNPHTPDEYRDYAESLKGTHLYRQEVMGEVVDDVAGALWTQVNIDRSIVSNDLDREKLLSILDRVIVAVDPPSGHGTCGIAVMGITNALEDPTESSRIVILDDFSIEDASPAVWGGRVVDAAKAYGANVIAERNQGGLMVESTIRRAAEDRGDDFLTVTLAHARISKEQRAAPVALLWELDTQRAVIVPPQGQMSRIALLIEQMTSWIPKTFSPDRLDAMVWGATELMRGGGSRAALQPARPKVVTPAMHFRQALMGMRR